MYTFLHSLSLHIPFSSFFLTLSQPWSGIRHTLHTLPRHANQFVGISFLFFFSARSIKIIEAAPGYKRVTISIPFQKKTRSSGDVWLVGYCLSMFQAAYMGVCVCLYVCVLLAYVVWHDTLLAGNERGCSLGLSSDFYLLHKSTRTHCCCCCCYPG